jgi:preprotein translocase subunit SecD
MSAELKDKAAGGLKKVLSGTWSLTINTARRADILRRHGLAYWQQRKIDRALSKVGHHTFQALEQGESNPLTAPEVNEALAKARKLKENKDKNYQAMEAIRERIRASRVKEPSPPPPAAAPPEAPPAETAEVKETKEAEETKEAAKPEEPPTS